MGGGGGDRLAAGDPFDRGSESDESGESGGATPGWDDTELHFGKADFHLGIVGCDSKVAPGGEFRATSQATAGDYGDGGKRESRKSLEELLAELGSGAGGCGGEIGPARGEILQIGAAEETARFSGANDETSERRLWVPLFQVIQVARELLQGVTRKNIDGPLRIVPGEPSDIGLWKI